MPPPNDALFNSKLWETALERFGAATNLTVKLFGAGGDLVFGPAHPTTLFQLFEENGYDPGLFSECALRCLAQTDDRPAVMVSEVGGMAVIGISLALQGEIVGTAVGGYALIDFCQALDVQSMARTSGIAFERLWRVAREQRPVSQRQLVLQGELLQVLGDALLSENFRSRQYEEIAGDLEHTVQQRTAAVRKLSADLIHLQDDERRRISRELHDTVGQYLAHAKMSLDTLNRPDATEQEAQAVAHVAETLDKCLSETRTISYLLHPALLDEVGLAFSAKWYAQGFSQRSGIGVNLHIPHDLKRLPGAAELVLFRILQESLTNIHRHAQSKSVDVQVELGDGEVTLEVRDYGKGIPLEFLERFRNGGGGGVGLRSMRERVSELNGRFEIESGNDGTTIRAAIPVPATQSALAASVSSDARY